MTTRTVGVIGLGIMGGAMARNLMALDWSVLGFDTDPKQCSVLADDGVQIMASALEVARGAAVIISSLPKPEAVIDTARIIADGRPEQRIVIEVSTLALDDKRSAREVLENAGHILLDCPVSGTGAQARTRDLVVYASGDTQAIEQVQPVFDAIAREAHDVGEFGNGTRMKFIANLLVSVHNVASAEALVLGQKAGLDLHQMVKVIGSGIGTSRIFDVRAPMMAEGVYQPPTAHLATAAKDLKIIARFAADLDCPTPMLSATEPVYAAAMSRGLGREDSAVICELLQELAGLKR